VALMIAVFARRRDEGRSAAAFVAIGASAMVLAATWLLLPTPPSLPTGPVPPTAAVSSP